MDALRFASLLSELPRERTSLLDNLGRIRREVGPITPELSDALADHMNIRRGEVDEVQSFYSFLRVPADAYRVCTGPVCDCFGARELLTDDDAVEVPCLGHCELAPVTTRGDTILQPVTHRTNEGASLGLHQADETLADYERRGGLALLHEPLPNERIVEELKASGLSGYGGAGFPTGVKWEAVAREPAPRYVVVNADEGEPGTIKDRYVMELRPHLLLEATVLAMRFADASEGFIYLREEYATARNTVLLALEEFRAAGLLDGLSLELVVGAGRVHLRRGDGDARVDGGPARDAAAEAAVPEPVRLPRPPDADQQRRDARPHPGDPARRRRVVAARPALVGHRRGARAGLLRGAARRHAAAADRRLRGRRDGGDRCDSSPAARRAASSRRTRSTSR